MLALILFTLLATACFVAGLFSLRSLGRLDCPTEAEQADPFYSKWMLLFSTAPRSRDFRRRQRLTIWLFSGAILLLFMGRYYYVASTTNTPTIGG